MALFSRHLNLLHESQEIYLRNLKRRYILGAISAAIFAGTYYYYYVNNIPNLLDSRAAVFPLLALLAMFVDRMYVVFNQQTYWQLRRQDVAKGKDEAAEILQSMKGMKHANK